MKRRLSFSALTATRFLQAGHTIANRLQARVSRVARLACCLLLSLPVVISGTAAAQPIQMLGAEFQSGGKFYAVDVADGSVSVLGTTAGTSFFAAMDFSPDGVLWAAASFLYEVNPTDGSEISRRTIAYTSPPTNDIITGLSFSPSGELFGIGNGNGNLWRIDTDTAQAQFIGSSGASMFSLEFGGDGTLYGAGHNLYRINTANGSATLVGSIGGTPLINALDFAPNGVMYGASNDITDDSLYAINLTTGAGTLIGFTGGNLVSLASVPEPSSLVLLSLGGVIALQLSIGRHRRRTST